jgi:hypothetical protein
MFITFLTPTPLRSTQSNYCPDVATNCAIRWVTAETGRSYSGFGGFQERKRSRRASAATSSPAMQCVQSYHFASGVRKRLRYSNVAFAGLRIPWTLIFLGFFSGTNERLLFHPFHSPSIGDLYLVTLQLTALHEVHVTFPFFYTSLHIPQKVNLTFINLALM